MVFLELWRDSRVTTGNSGCILCWSREVQSSIRVSRESWELLSSHCRQLYLIYSCVQKLMFLSRGERDLGVTFQTHPGSQASSRREATHSALLSSRNGYLLEPNEWPKGRQASCGVWREDSRLLFRPCGERRTSSCDEGGISWFFSSCSPSVGFLMRYNGELREPLVWCQGSPVSIRLARGSVALLSIHCRGIRPQDAQKGHF